MLTRPIVLPVVSPITRAVTAMSRGGWSPLRLFAASEVGAWYDPSDLSSMNTKSDGSGTVPGVGDPVGRILDKSGNGKHATQATDAARPLLQQDAGGRYYLDFDGTDDFLVTGSVDFTGTDKMTVVVGVRKASDVARAMLLELGSSLPAGSFYMQAPSVNAAQNYQLVSYGTVIREALASTHPAGTSYVLTGLSDIGGNSVAMRANGAQVGLNTADQGTGNYSAAAVYIGMRGGAFIPFGGRIYGLLIRGAASTAAEIKAVERYANGKTGAY